MYFRQYLLRVVLLEWSPELVWVQRDHRPRGICARGAEDLNATKLLCASRVVFPLSHLAATTWLESNNAPHNGRATASATRPGPQFSELASIESSRELVERRSDR